LLEAGEESEEAREELLGALKDRTFDDALTAAVVQQIINSNPGMNAYPAGVVLTARVRPGFFRFGAAMPVEQAQTDDSTDLDDTSSFRSGTYRPVSVTLEDHAEGVARRVSSFAERLGLDGSLPEVLRQAAKLHDIGKADPRFQFLLYGDEPGETLLAKSGKDWDAQQFQAVREQAGLPKGFRHELVSVAILRRHPELTPGLDAPLRLLVEYLVGTHHGRGRPFPPFIDEHEPEAVNLNWDGRRLTVSPDHRLWRLDAGWADGFWKLVRRYGYWGHSFLETLLRLADARCSAEEQRREDRG
jgi:CRISPR-associated endonuclease/helicase Cas3